MKKIGDMETRYKEVITLLYSDEGVRIPGYQEHEKRFVRGLAKSLCQESVKDIRALQEIGNHYKTFDKQLHEAVKREKECRQRK